jgi:hypothetical protein
MLSFIGSSLSHENAGGFVVTQRESARTNSRHDRASAKPCTVLNNDLFTRQKAYLL